MAWFVLAAALTAKARGEIAFLAERTVSLREPASAIALHDFDNDGALDVAVAGLDGGVFVHIHRGEAFEGLASTHDGGTSPLDLDVADLDQDGIADLVVTDSGSDSLLVLRGEGGGAFGKPQIHAVGSGPRQAVVADLDGNAFPDVAAMNNIGGSVTILLGRGGGALDAYETIRVGSSPHAVVPGDFDDNGHTDLAVAVGDEASAAMLWNSAGAAFEAARFPVGEVPRSLAAGDLDGDGKLDLAVANQNSRTLSLLLGDGKRGFPSQEVVHLPGPPDQVRAADLNGDGRLDLIVVLLDADAGLESELRVLLRREGAALADSGFSLRLGGTLAVEEGDLDGDGTVDLLVGSSAAGQLLLVTGSGDGAFLTRTLLETEARPRDVAAADFNGDGLIDLASCSSEGGTISFFAAAGAGAFGDRLDIKSDGSSLPGLDQGDFDGDGTADLVAADTVRGEVRIHAGRRGSPPRPATTLPGGLLPVDVAAGHFLGDGALDLAVLNQGSSDVAFFEGRGDGTFMARGAAAVLGAPSRFVAGDLDQDGIDDLVVAGRNAVAAFISDGMGGFRRRVDLPSRSASAAVALGDVDSNGTLDVVLGEVEGDLVFLLAARPAEFDPPRGMTLGGAPSAATVGDLDRDGVPEVLVALASRDALAVLARDAGGAFALAGLYAANDPRALAIEDLNGDGTLDLVTAEFSRRAVSILPGRPPRPAPFRRGDADVDGRVLLTDAVVVLGYLFQGGAEPSCPDAADTNGDGRIDLTDPVALLAHLFRSGDPPSPPGPEACGEDPEEDHLGPCAYTGC